MSSKVLRECRACLKNVDEKTGYFDLFAEWVEPTSGRRTTLAKELMTRIGVIQISPSDGHTKTICKMCYCHFKSMCNFVNTVLLSDNILKQRNQQMDNVSDNKSRWPKPIQVDTSLNGADQNDMEVQVKQELLSEDEYDTNTMEQDSQEPIMDIKIEPEEIVPQDNTLTNIRDKGTDSVAVTSNTNSQVNNGARDSIDEEYLDGTIKQEPSSEDELEEVLDLPLECMLCAKTFNRVTGLKAHVIAQHSYISVERKTANCTSPENKHNRYVCSSCRRSFQTSTDLMVHETRHNKHACYVCNAKFTTFEQLTQHGKTCTPGGEARLKTLDVVKRSLPDVPSSTPTNPSSRIGKEMPNSSTPTTESCLPHENTSSKDPKENVHKRIPETETSSKGPLENIIETQEKSSEESMDTTKHDKTSKQTVKPGKTANLDERTDTKLKTINSPSKEGKTDTVNTQTVINTVASTEQISEIKGFSSEDKTESILLTKSNLSDEQKTKTVNVQMVVDSEEASVKQKSQIQGNSTEKLTESILEAKHSPSDEQDTVAVQVGCSTVEQVNSTKNERVNKAKKSTQQKESEANIVSAIEDNDLEEKSPISKADKICLETKSHIPKPEGKNLETSSPISKPEEKDSGAKSSISKPEGKYLEAKSSSSEPEEKDLETSSISISEGKCISPKSPISVAPNQDMKIHLAVHSVNKESDLMDIDNEDDLKVLSASDCEPKNDASGLCGEK